MKNIQIENFFFSYTVPTLPDVEIETLSPVVKKKAVLPADSNKVCTLKELISENADVWSRCFAVVVDCIKPRKARRGGFCKKFFH